jgi:hypothetical protein
MADLAKGKVLSMPLSPRGRWHNRNNIQGLQAISAICERDERFRFPNADALNNPLLSNINGEKIRKGALHDIALHSILTDQSRWDLMFDTCFDIMKSARVEYRYISIGEKVIVPRMGNGTPSPRLPQAIVNGHENNGSCDSDDTHLPSLSSSTQSVPNGLSVEVDPDLDLIPESAIAIIGMACRYPEADSIEEFWDVISAGKCVIRALPEDRFKPSELVHEPRGPFWGGYVRRTDLFDHRFFGISGREAKSMDPQQRMALAVYVYSFSFCCELGFERSKLTRKL